MLLKSNYFTIIALICLNGLTVDFILIRTYTGMILLQPAFMNQPSPVITAIVRSHAIIFTGKSLDTFDETLGEIKSNLDGHIGRITKNYLKQGYCIAISNCIALLGYGVDDNPLALLLKSQQSADATALLLKSQQSADADTIMRDADADTDTDADADTASSPTFTASLRLFTQVAKIHLERIGDPNTLSFIHVTLVFIRHLSRHPAAASLIYPHFPWNNLVRDLNALIVLFPPNRAAIESPTIPIPDSGPSPARQETTPHTPPPPSAPLDPTKLDMAGAHDAVAPAKDIFRPFPEEFAMQGLGFTAGYFPEKWFGNENVEPETHYLEAESMRCKHRPGRVQWLGVQLAQLAPEWIGYSNEYGCTFSLGKKAKEYLDDTEGESSSGSEYGDEIDSDRGSRTRSESGTLTIEVDDRPVSEEGDGGGSVFLDMRGAGITFGGLEAGDASGDVG